MNTFVKAVNESLQIYNAEYTQSYPRSSSVGAVVRLTDSSRVRLRVRSEWGSKRAPLRGYDKCLTTKARGQIVNLTT
jgi:2-methylcitrate dehydratase PrpD